MTTVAEPALARAEVAVAGTTQPAAPSFEPLAIAVDRCKGCGLCVSVCPQHVLELDERVVNPLGHHPVRMTDAGPCTSCALCARICPDAVFAVFAPGKQA